MNQDIYKDYRNKNGHIVIPLTAIAVIDIFKGLGICDSCNKSKPSGYIIPVLAGRWYCDDCTKEWENDKSTKFFEEDREYEEAKAMRIIKTMVFNNLIFMEI